MKNNKTIDKIILKYSNRGMDKLQGVYPKEFCKEAAEKFITLNKGIVFLYTGFYVKGFAETDGPLGTYFLALGLEKLGFTPIVITDLYCENYFKNIKTLLIPLAGYNHETYAKILEKYKPICHFSIERLGRDKHNDYRNSRKVDIKEFTAPLDELYLMGSKNSPTFAIGDGGNEIGMGNFKDFLETKLNINPCIIKSDYPIIATV
ncbi:MAG: DUF4392 domain-containing protein, partial [Campylobacteraceae bacterium]|nr:DUF4392 domain-containing protein [Campylobacteraceae bacterium]